MNKQINRQTDRQAIGQTNSKQKDSHQINSVVRPMFHWTLKHKTDFDVIYLILDVDTAVASSEKKAEFKTHKIAQPKKFNRVLILKCFSPVIGVLTSFDIVLKGFNEF